MIRNILKSIGLLPYAQHYREILLPAPSQQRELSFLPERISFYGQFIGPGDLCFDVGANIGNRTRVFLRLGANVVAVEPQAECAARLKLRFGNGISLVKKALGATEGTGTLFVGDSSAISSLSEDWIETLGSSRFLGRRWSTKTTVPITTLDKLIAEFGKPKFCKIDVEGFEEEVLKGLSDPIPYISLEYAAPEKIGNISRCFDELAKLGDFSCNYTVGESMKFALNKWTSPPSLLARLSMFQEKPIFGDVYIKFQV